MLDQQKLAVILFADIVDYTALMQRDEREALKTLGRFKEVLERQAAQHKGEIIQYFGDGALLTFDSSSSAVACAMGMQETYRSKPVVPVRIGLHLGDVLFRNNNVFGDGVNVASRVESLGVSGAILMSKAIRDQLKNKSDYQLSSLGQFEFKNVQEPMEVYALANEGFPVPEADRLQGKLREKQKPQKRPAWIWAGLGLLLITALVLWSQLAIGTSRPNSGAMGILEKSIAVLPFDSYSTREEHLYFAQAVADEIRSQLLGITNLKVISGYSSKHYKGLNISSEQIGEELGVQYILQGNVQQLANSVKVGVELSNTNSNNLEWSPAPFERPIEDIFLLQNEIAQQIVQQLSLRLTSAEQEELKSLPTQDPDAYQAFMQGQELMKRNRSNINELDEAIVFLKKATTLDPDFDRAYLALAEAYMDYCLWGRMPAKKGVEYALDAIFKVADNKSAEYIGILGAINYNRRKIGLAKALLERSLSMNSNYLLAQVRLAWLKNNVEDKTEEAVNLLDVARSVDPKDPVYYSYTGLLYYYDRNFERGLEVIREGLQVAPQDNFLRWTHGYLYAGMGEYEKAIEIFTNRSVARQTNWMIAYCYGKLGREQEAREILNYLLERRSRNHVPAHMIASVYIGLGEYEKALDWLEVDVEEGGHEHFYWGMRTDIKYDPLRDDERFQSLLDIVFDE